MRPRGGRHPVPDIDISAKLSAALPVFLVDAFVVRLALVPAVMTILGERIWYHPRWYARLVPDPDIEGEKLEEELDHHPGERRLTVVA
ncbi:hypothetical protein ACFZB9_09130 [Kitasatospora sp. NPDC008050]|uniref:hypothetical protein n=1 Tax=Kitasatospora sp. NPDC008050 TaxID=3364021 RepID=UPI0036EE15B0